MRPPYPGRLSTAWTGNAHALDGGLSEEADGGAIYPWHGSCNVGNPKLEPPMPALTVTWSPAKSLWNGGALLGALLLCPQYIDLSAMAMAAVFAAITLCCGHSAGIHRGLIHRSYEARPWVRGLLAYLGTLVGLGGPISLLALHNTRDHFQNTPDCPAFYGHTDPLWRDFFTQNHGVATRTDGWTPPLDPTVTGSAWMRFLDATARWQQLPVALALYAAGGWSWVAWGLFARVAIGVHGHWLVGWFAHNEGAQPRTVLGSAIQGTNNRLFGAMSFGEGWHNNHHAFPRSARLGLEPGQLDGGWLFLQVLARLGLVWNLITPDQEAALEPGRTVVEGPPALAR
jgi:stearoyl-CoA desaturase (delta-9 desaturase)